MADLVAVVKLLRNLADVLEEGGEVILFLLRAQGGVVAVLGRFLVGVQLRLLRCKLNASAVREVG